MEHMVCRSVFLKNTGKLQSMLVNGPTLYLFPQQRVRMFSANQGSLFPRSDPTRSDFNIMSRDKSIYYI